MKKLFLLWLLPFSLQFLHAQNYILQGVTGVTGPTGTTGSNIYQDANGLIGIGSSTTPPTPAANLDVQGSIGLSSATPIIAPHYWSGVMTYAPDYITASRDYLGYPPGSPNVSVPDFNVNPVGQVGIGAANIIGEYPIPLDLFIQTHGWPSGSLPNGVIVALDDNTNPLFAAGNIGTATYSSGDIQIFGNSNLIVAALDIQDNGSNLSAPVLFATGNGLVMMGTYSPIAQVDINNNMYTTTGGYTPLDYLFHVGDESISKDYLTVANNSNVEVGIGMLPTGSTLSIKGTEGTTLNIYETSGVGDIEWYGADGDLRHAIYDDVAGTGNLVIWPGILEGSNTVEIEGNELVDNTLTVGANPAPSGLGSGTFASAILSVDGQLAAKEIVVTVTSWSDTVFSNTYQLKPLSQVENYINQNHHLPDVPSEKEVIKDGISLGDMNKVLLQKVEELTLYVMKQQKEIEALKQK